MEDTDAHYSASLNIMADISQTLLALTSVLKKQNITFDVSHPRIRQMLSDELHSCANDDSMPMKPQRIVYDTRRAVPEGTTVLVDTGALKMWMARLYPTMHPNTCIIDNSLSTMAWTLPGLSLIHISEPTRPRLISYAVFCLKKKKRKKKRKKKKTFFFFFFNDTATTEIYTLSVVGSVRCV